MAKRILIADDSVTIQKAFAMTLAGEDLSLVAARSVEEGLSLAQKSRPDLVIADGVMTTGSGYDLCLAIKSDPALRGVPVYILTSLHHPFDDARARQVAADGQFVKPFETLSLVAGIADALAKGVVAGPPLQAPARAVPAVPVSSMDDYGEISVGNDGADSVVVAPTPAPVPIRPVAPAPAPAAAAMRPSLIPGMRPGAAPARPGAAPVRSPGMPSPGPAPGPTPMMAPLPSAVRGPALPTNPNRTMIGMPTAGLQPPPRMAVPGGGMVPSVRSALAPGADLRAPAPGGTGLSAQVAASVASRVAERMAAVSARGPEYEAVAKLSKEIIEKIAWEIVPELAEAIIREELQKRGRI